MPPNFVPVLPESAPFTAEQRAYLNGFLAGLFSHSPVGWTTPGGAAPAAPPLVPLLVLYGSQTGTAEGLAKRVAKQAGQNGFAATIQDLARVQVSQLPTMGNLLLVTSTYGDGEPPDGARAFWDALKADSAPRLTDLHFSVCALGDSSYAKFCGFGRDLDGRLLELGAKAVTPRGECDVDYERPFNSWLGGALAALRPAAGANPGASPAAVPALSEPEIAAGFSKTNPYPARLLVNRRLSGAGSAKEVRHLEIGLPDSGVTYEVGDALSVKPQNDPEVVTRLLSALGARGDEALPEPGSGSLRDALMSRYEISRVPRPLLEQMAEQSGDAAGRRLLTPDGAEDLNRYLRGRDVVDLLAEYPKIRLAPVELIRLLRPLQPRLYSISSSLKAHPAEVHLTVGIVRYENLGRARGGVCSTWLADRATADPAVPVFVHTNSAFRPPAPALPLIMVGPGTGIAPFRAFLEERRAVGATGRNWLFFGDQKSTTDFLYQGELEEYFRDGLLTRLDLAWSRESAHKVYVQDKMRGHARELYEWLEAGAGFYVCGDASRMAKDVDTTLHEIIQTGGDRTVAQAKEYVDRLKADGRYRRDVY